MRKKLKIRKFAALMLACVMVFSIFIPVNSSATTRKNNHSTNSSAVTRKNDYPIVLCHGCNGWGRDENFGSLAFGAKYYWGGNVDFQQELVDRGFTTYTAAVGPLSSNWDRTCELYAEIKGGTVDYGAAHSSRYGHARYGRTYEGFFTQWGTKDSDGNENKVHLIGHSQGGQTVRMLSELLGEGSAEERSASGDSVSLLFKGGNSWVDSVTTLATPNDGTTLADVKGTNTMAGVGLAALGSILGDMPDADIIYDIKLDQYGLKRRSDESLLRFIKRCKRSSMWTNSKDNCAYDLSTDGAVVQNKWVKAQSDTYYFSWACKGTMKKPFSFVGHQIANPFIMRDKKLCNAQWAVQAAFMGAYHRRNYSREIPVIGRKWWPNDGYVNTISESGPKYGSTDKIVNYNGTAQIGKWNFMGIKKMDHEDIIGRNWDGALGFFIDMATMLSQLPK